MLFITIALILICNKWDDFLFKRTSNHLYSNNKKQSIKTTRISQNELLAFKPKQKNVYKCLIRQNWNKSPEWIKINHFEQKMSDWSSASTQIYVCSHFYFHLFQINYRFQNRKLFRSMFSYILNGIITQSRFPQFSWWGWLAWFYLIDKNIPRLYLIFYPIARLDYQLPSEIKFIQTSLVK